MQQKPYLLLLALFCASYLFGQGEANNWYFGNYAGLSFNSDPPVALTNGALTTSEGCATISDAAGNLLFYSDGLNVWNRNHVIMSNGTGLLGNPSSAQSAIIIPKPGSTRNYYIITVPEAGAVGMRFSEIDMTLAGGLGAILPGNKNTLMFAPSSEKVTAVKHANGIYYWVVGRENGSSKKYVSFLIDCNGVNTTPVESVVGITNGENWGYLVASPNATKLASASTSTGIEVTDFDNLTGVVSNAVALGALNYFGYNNGSYGVAFSPNSNLLYATNIHNWALAQWDLTAANIPATETLIGYTSGSSGTRPSYNGGALQLASDGKIYVAEIGLSSLGVINNPNVPGAGCNFVASQVGLAGRICVLGLPPFVTSFLISDSDITYTNDCVESSTSFSITGAAVLDSVRWNFGDPVSGSNNESTALVPVHTYNTPGTYNVTLIRYIACVEDTINTQITIHDYKRYTKNISLCFGENFTLPGGAVVNQSGTYIDTLATTSLPACDSIVTTIITAPSLSFTLTNDTSICIGNSVQLDAQGGVEYEWDADPTLSSTTIPDPVATPVVTTTYTVRTKMQVGDNLVVNGDFEAGNTGFSSGYIYSPPNPLGPPGHYTVAPNVTNGWWPTGCGDHTSGSGNALIMDGADGTSGVAAGTSYWCQAIPVEPNTEYAFSSWLINVNGTGNTSTLGFEINGAQIGTPQTTPLAPCQWNEFYVIWNSGSATSATICLSETSGGQPGNDFAIDDISFYKLCEVVDSVEVVVSNPQPAINPPVNVTCNGLSNGSANASVTGGIAPYVYSWNTTPVQSTANAVNLPAGTYVVTITDAINCVVDSSVTITEPAVLTPVISAQTNASCYQSTDGTATVSVTGGTAPYSYSWNTIPVQTTAVATGLAAGAYRVVVTDSNNCVDSVSVLIGQPTALSIAVIDQTDVSCFGLSDGSAEVQASGGTAPYQYSWNTAPVQTGAVGTNLTAGNYIVTVTDDNACTTTLSVAIDEPDVLQLSVGASHLLICPGDYTTITANATGGTTPYSITWTQGLPANQWSHSVSPTGSTTYSATVTDSNACQHTAQLVVDVVQLPVVSFYGTNLVGCVPLTTAFQNTSTGNYASCEWTMEDGTLINGCTDISNTFEVPGCQDVTLTLTTIEGCTNSHTITDYVCAEPAPVADFFITHQQLSGFGTSVEFENMSQHATNYFWDFGDETGFSYLEDPTHEYSNDMSAAYTVMLVASNTIGCYDTTYLIVRIDEVQLFYVPNTFTPDGDQFNQTFKPVISSGIDIYNYSLTIYNRWGELIFESRDVEVGWDGVSHRTGVLCQDGTYVWKIELKSRSVDERKTIHGTVNLIR